MHFEGLGEWSQDRHLGLFSQQLGDLLWWEGWAWVVIRSSLSRVSVFRCPGTLEMGRREGVCESDAREETLVPHSFTQ